MPSADFQRDEFRWCDQQVPRLFLACSTKIVAMATLRGQASKETHCERRNARDFQARRKGAQWAGFQRREQKLLPTSQAGPQAAVYLVQ